MRARHVVNMTDWNEHFTYCPTSGSLRWRERERHLFKTERAWKASNTARAGHLVSSTDRNGYLVARIKRKHFYVHRIVWEMHYGPIPTKMQVDHIDRNKTNNALSNLRLATAAENIWNSASKTPGVQFHKGRGKYIAKMRVNGRQIWLGTFTDPSEAAEAYREASRKFHGPFSPYITN
jgi:hypothetical protein